MCIQTVQGVQLNQLSETRCLILSSDFRNLVRLCVHTRVPSTCTTKFSTKFSGTNLVLNFCADVHVGLDYTVHVLEYHYDITNCVLCFSTTRVYAIRYIYLGIVKYHTFVRATLIRSIPRYMQMSFLIFFCPKQSFSNKSMTN